jgi:2',3'-cyclic-nucleotide 3'-phosphodiesterase
MPGNSLWLVPPPSHPLTVVLSKLIAEKLPPLFASRDSAVPKFQPHITITSDISTDIPTAEVQNYLDGLSLPTELPVKFESVEVG